MTAMNRVDGPIGAALAFDGVDDIVDTVAVSLLNLGAANFTVSARLNESDPGDPIMAKDNYEGLEDGLLNSSVRPSAATQVMV